MQIASFGTAPRFMSHTEIDDQRSELVGYNGGEGGHQNSAHNVILRCPCEQRGISSGVVHSSIANHSESQNGGFGGEGATVEKKKKSLESELESWVRTAEMDYTFGNAPAMWTSH